MQATITMEQWWSRALWLAGLTVAWNVAEGLAAMGFGLADESVALFGFGVDSWVEVTSAAVVTWRLQGESGRGRGASLERERRATKGIGLLMGLLGVGMAFGGVASVLEGNHPHTALPGVVVSVLSLLFMAFLWQAKVRVGAELGSRTVLADAACSRACMQLSVVLLAGSLLSVAAPALWWADGVAAVVLGVLVGREGLAGWRAASAPEFDGGGCCGGCGHDDGG